MALSGIAYQVASKQLGVELFALLVRYVDEGFAAEYSYEQHIGLVAAPGFLWREVLVK